jgi:hypothetical protein
MSEKEEEVPLQDTASLAGHRLSEAGARMTSPPFLGPSPFLRLSAFLASVLDDDGGVVGVRVTPSWKVLSSPWILLGV